MSLKSYVAEEIALDCKEGLLTRREALRRLGLLGLGAAASATLLAACGSDSDDDAAPATTSGGGATTIAGAAGALGEEITFEGPRGQLRGAWAAATDPHGALLVIHENRGLSQHIKTLPPRFASEGFSALAVDLLSEEGGTAAIDEGAAQAALGSAPPERLIADLRAGVDELARRVPGEKLGVIGFCFGGGLTWQLLQAGEARLAAAAPFYGPAPDPSDFSKAKAAVFAVYGELDGDRVNGTRERAASALQSAGLVHEVKVYPGADHAFFNDTGPRYNADAARQAFTDVLAWFTKYLA